MFAMRDGIIDRSSYNAEGRRIVFSGNQAFAVMMDSDEEIWSPDPYTFTYRANSNDPGRYRLTSATRDSRGPVRIIRCHTLRSFWAPKAGVRYDGLHKVVAWSIHFEKKVNGIVYDITFKRLHTETVDMEEVMCHPWAEEVEDYRLFKKLKAEERLKLAKAAKKAQEKNENAVEAAGGSKKVVPAGTDGADGTLETVEDSQDEENAGGHAGEGSAGTVVHRPEMERRGIPFPMVWRDAGDDVFVDGDAFGQALEDLPQSKSEFDGSSDDALSDEHMEVGTSIAEILAGLDMGTTPSQPQQVVEEDDEEQIMPPTARLVSRRLSTSGQEWPVEMSRRDSVA
jgi:hypothetical protein